MTLSPEPAIVRYLLMLSLTGLFVAPALLAMLISLFVLLAFGEVRIYWSTRRVISAITRTHWSTRFSKWVTSQAGSRLACIWRSGKEQNA